MVLPKKQIKRKKTPFSNVLPWKTCCSQSKVNLRNREKQGNKYITHLVVLSIAGDFKISIHVNCGHYKKNLLLHSLLLEVKYSIIKQTKMFPLPYVGSVVNICSHTKLKINMDIDKTFVIIH